MEVLDDTKDDTVETVVSNSQDDLEGVDFYTVGSDVLEYSHEILVQGSVTIDSRQQDKGIIKSEGGTSKILEYAEKFRGRPPKFEASEVDSDGQAWYTCTVCSIKCTGRSELLHHLRTHNKDRPFHCKECGANFKQVVHLRAHLRMHTGEKPFACTRCDKKFRQKAILDQHTRTHTQDRPYKCTEDGCDKAFAQKTSLKNHLRSHKTGILSKNYRRKERKKKSTNECPGPPLIDCPANPSSQVPTLASVAPSTQPHINYSSFQQPNTIPKNSEAQPSSSDVTSGDTSIQNKSPAKQPVKIIDMRRSPQTSKGKFKTTIVKMTSTQFKEYIRQKYPRMKQVQPHSSDRENSKASKGTVTNAQDTSAKTTPSKIAKANTEYANSSTSSFRQFSNTDKISTVVYQPLQLESSSTFPSEIRQPSASPSAVAEQLVTGGEQLTAAGDRQLTDQQLARQGMEGCLGINPEPEPFLNFVNLHKQGLELEYPHLSLVELLEELAARWNRMTSNQKSKFSGTQAYDGDEEFREDEEDSREEELIETKRSFVIDETGNIQNMQEEEEEVEFDGGVEFEEVQEITSERTEITIEEMPEGEAELDIEEMSTANQELPQTMSSSYLVDEEDGNSDNLYRYTIFRSEAPDLSFAQKF